MAAPKTNRTMKTNARFKLPASSELGLLIIVMVYFAAMSLYKPEFCRIDIVKVMLLTLSVNAIIACGMAILLVSGGFDLSVGSVLGLSGMVAALGMVRYGMPFYLALLLGLLTGTAVGALNGFVIARLRINPFITTLGSMIWVRGLVKVIGGSGVYGFPEAFKWLGQGMVFGVQMPIIFCLVIVAVGEFLLRKSRFLRQNFYIGGNERSAILSGIPAARVKMFNYILSGLLAGFAGLLTTARYGNASVTAGTGVELQVVTAVIIGGASLSGGKGSILGAFLGTLLMVMIVTSIDILRVRADWHDFVVGAVLLTAVILDNLRRKER
jgi:ribose transport system permease protein